MRPARAALPSPLVSVLLPVRDAEATLGAALDSLTAEPGDDLEFVVVDDGSRDGSPAVAREHARRDPRVVVVARERAGLVAALNAGAAACRGELLCRQDADDLSVPGRVRASAEHLRAHPQDDLVAACVEVFRDDGPPGLGMARWAAWSNSLATHADIARERFVEAPFAHDAVTLRAAVLRAAGGYRDGDFPEDYELWLRLLARGARFARLPQVGVRVRDHGRRLVRTDPRYRPAAFRALKLAHLRGEVLRPGEPVLVWGGGRVAKSWARELAAAGIAVAALVDVNPRRIGRLVHGVPVVAPEAAGCGGRFGTILALGAVGQPGGRESVRAQLAALGRREGVDLHFVA